LVNLKPLTPILTLVGLFSTGLGYLRAYTGPFFIVSLLKAGYTYEQIASIHLLLAVFWVVSALAILIILVGVSYRYGVKYKLTLVSGFVLVVLVYLAELLGNLIGVAVYQIQATDYPILPTMTLEILTSYGYVYFCLIGVLAANYVRETRQQLTNPQ